MVVQDPSCQIPCELGQGAEGCKCGWNLGFASLAAVLFFSRGVPLGKPLLQYRMYADIVLVQHNCGGQAHDIQACCSKIREQHTREQKQMLHVFEDHPDGACARQQLHEFNLHQNGGLRDTKHPLQQGLLPVRRPSFDMRLALTIIYRLGKGIHAEKSLTCPKDLEIRRSSLSEDRTK